MPRSASSSVASSEKNRDATASPSSMNSTRAHRLRLASGPPRRGRGCDPVAHLALQERERLGKVGATRAARPGAVASVSPLAMRKEIETAPDPRAQREDHRGEMHVVEVERGGLRGHRPRDGEAARPVADVGHGPAARSTVAGIPCTVPLPRTSRSAAVFMIGSKNWARFGSGRRRHRKRGQIARPDAHREEVCVARPTLPAARRVLADLDERRGRRMPVSAASAGRRTARAASRGSPPGSRGSAPAAGGAAGRCPAR